MCNLLKHTLGMLWERRMTMKKLLSILLSLCMLLGVVGCDSPKVEYVYAPSELYAIVEDALGNEYTIDVSREEGKTVKNINNEIEYLARYDTQVFLQLKGIYEKDGTPLAEEFYQSGFEDGNNVHLAFVGTYEMPKACYIYYLANGSRYNDYEVKFNFNVTVKADKTLHNYVTIPDAEIPYDYFACEMQEISADTYDLTAFQDVLGGMNNTDDYEKGYLSQCFASDSVEAKRLNYSSQIYKQQTKEDIVWQTEMLHSVDPNAKYSWETYQYTQIKGEDPHELNPAYGLNETDGVFSAGTHKQGGTSDCIDLPFELEVVKEGTNLSYKAEEKDGYLYLSISGVLQNFWYPRATIITATYKIQGNKIVAWLFETKDVAADEYGYWTTAQYCIPLEGEIELLDEAILDELCTLY